jgi:predicted MFS family arabinose efflux permease
MSRMTSGFAPLRHPGFRLLASGQLASNVGDAFYMVALPWYVLATHGGALLLGTVLAAYGIPRTLLLAVGGQASDRWHPWTVMMVSDSVRVLAAAGLAVAAAAGPARAAILVPIAVVLGAGEGMFLPGSFAIIPALLPDADLQPGNALVSAGTQLATLIGPVLGGVMVALVGPSPAFALDAASFAISALTLAGIRAAKYTEAAKPAATPELAGQPVTAPAGAPTPAGGRTTTLPPDTGSAPAAKAPTVLSVLRTERVIQIGLLVTIVANLGSGGMDGVALPSLAHGPLHAGAGGFGGLIAAFGAGALLGTLASAHFGRLRRPAIGASLAFLIEAVAMALVPYLGGVSGAGAAIAVLGVMNGFGNVVMITAFQRWAPPDLLGRLSGVLMLASLGVYPISVVIGAFVVHGLGPAPFFPLAGAALGVAILAGLTQSAWRSFGMVTGTSSADPEPSTASTASTASTDETLDSVNPDTVRYAS